MCAAGPAAHSSAALTQRTRRLLHTSQYVTVDDGDMALYFVPRTI